MNSAVDFFSQFISKMIEEDLFEVFLFFVLFLFILLAYRNTRDQSVKLIVGFFLLLSFIVEGVFIYQRFFV